MDQQSTAQKQTGVIISPFCDYDCVFCKGIPHKISALKTDEMENKLLENISWFVLQGLTDLIEISGADPAEYEKLDKFIYLLKLAGFRKVRLSTNAYRLADYELASRLVTAGLDILRVRLYGHNAKIHGKVARKKDAFKNTMQAIDNFRELGIEISAHTKILKANINYLEELYDLLREVNTNKGLVEVGLISIAQKELLPHYVPIKDLSKPLLDLIKYAEHKNCKLLLQDIPYCVLGFDYPDITFTEPPELGQQQPPADLQSSERNVPRYRLQKQVAMCADCTLKNKCKGFYVNDVDRFGTGKLKPVK